MADQTTDDEVLVDLPSAGIAVVTLNQPSRMNAIDVPMRLRILGCLEELAANDDVRVIIITGGEKYFSAGGDIKSMVGIDAMHGRERMETMHRLVRAMVRLEKPVIAAVEGYAMGAGLCLAALSDIAVAAENSVWSCPFNQVGLVPDTGAFWILPQRMGVGRARRLMMLGERISGTEAVRDGLADVLCPPGQALDTALKLAGQLLEKAPPSLAMTKSLLANFPQSLDQALASERDAQAVLFQTTDFTEGRSAFLEKRKPNFTGK